MGVLSDIVFPDGDNQGLLEEIGAGILYSPIDILYAANFVEEIPASAHLGTPLDIVFKDAFCEEFPASGGEINYGWVT